MFEDLDFLFAELFAVFLFLQLYRALALVCVTPSASARAFTPTGFAVYYAVSVN